MASWALIMETKLSLPSPAKLNLFLHINGRLPNGYHELQSLFHFIDYGDRLDFETIDTATVSLTCNLPELETEDNLITRAAKALQPYLNKDFPTPGVKIHLHKVLPMGGGVGGGSSNAATTLLALNKLWSLNLPLSKLESIGNTLGADVPIFVRGRSSVADGTGEQMRDYQVADNWYLVLTPNAHVNTAKLFNAPDLTRDTAKIPYDDIKYDGISDRHKNDFEPLVTKNYPDVAKSLDWLLEYAPSRMTGTGACVFAEFSDEAQAQTVLKNLPNDMSGFIAKGCNVSPTHKVLFGNEMEK